ncbi:hypothetical protein HNQ94_003576 [Salirhabdus euzebyi]|uniref:Uncharacterized protein n=1 Tax=Salirhabdus euzebyi TaxID=394506 RepID=A0A841Q9B2_9BACI|nr:hypothetical protein [Salirhabdus euzebyi]
MKVVVALHGQRLNKIKEEDITDNVMSFLIGSISNYFFISIPLLLFALEILLIQAN